MLQQSNSRDPLQVRAEFPLRICALLFRWVIPAALICSPALSQIADLRIVGKTNTQVLLAYTAPSADQTCSIAVSEHSSLSPLIHDINPALFANANLDSREGAVRNGTQRVFVIGQRRSDKAGNGKLYSRALQADTTHYYRIQCGTSATENTFVTENIIPGLTHTELPPFDPAGSGNYAWPSIDWADRNKTYIDPLTGIEMRLLTRPGDWGNRNVRTFAPTHYTDHSGLWTNAANIVSGSSSRLASVSAAGAPIFAGVEPLSFPPGQLGGFHALETMDDFAVHLTGSGSDSIPANRQVDICLTINSGVSCYTDPIVVTLPQGSASDAGLVPSVFPKPMFGGWSRPAGREHLPTIGKVTVASGMVTLVKNQYGGEPDADSWFSLSWTPGTKIWINGSAPTCANDLCTIASVKNASTVTLQETRLSLGETDYKGAGFGVRITKKTGIGTVALSARPEVAWSYGWGLPPSGATDQCSRKAVQTRVAADGTPISSPLSGYLCIFPNTRGAGGLFFLGSNGESRFISAVRTPASIPGHAAQDLPSPLVGHAGPSKSTFPSGQGNVFYVTALSQSTKNSIYRLTYNGDYRELRYNYPEAGGGEQPHTPSDNIAWENITKSSEGKDIQTQIARRFPQYNSARYGTFDGVTASGISGKYMAFSNNTGLQDSPCWVFLLNLETGVIESGFNSWDGRYHPYLRWVGCHSVDAISIPNYFFIAAPPMAQNLDVSVHGGPYTVPVTKVKKGGIFVNDTSLSWPVNSGYDNTCPSDLDAKFKSQGAVGNHCVTVRVLGEPCNAAPTPQEKVWSPCAWSQERAMLQAIEIGDMAVDSSRLASERLRVVKRSTGPAGELELVLQRDAGSITCSMAYLGNAAFGTHANGWSLMMVPGAPGNCEGALYLLDSVSKTIQSEHPNISSGHWDIGTGQDEGKYTTVGASLSSAGITYAVRLNKGPETTGQLEDFMVPSAQGFGGIADNGDYIQGYASIRQWNASAEDRRWTLDFRHMNGYAGAGAESPYNTLFTVNASLQSGTTQVYRVGVYGTIDYKRLPILVYAGRYLLLEKSAPQAGNTLTDTDVFRYCFAYKTGECRVGSSAGDLFAVIPQATLTGFCHAGQNGRNIPCAFSGPGVRGWVTQSDVTNPNGTVRRLTMAFNGPGKHYPYANVRATPDGKWAVINGFWVDGLRQDLLLAKLPRFPVSNSTYSDQFTTVTIEAPRVDGATHARVEFGYRENGAAGDFFCTGRQEMCVAGLSSNNAPFQFASESPSGITCLGGCVIPVSALPGRILYYRIRHMNSSGGTVRLSSVGVHAVSIVSTPAANCTYSVLPSSSFFPASGGSGTSTVSSSSTCNWQVSNAPSWITFASSGPLFRYTVEVNPGSAARTASFTVAGNAFSIIQEGNSTITPVPTNGLRFVPLEPCRMVETRPEYNYEGRTGSFGPPFLSASETRTLVPANSNVCRAIPASAKALVLNLTLAPRGIVDFITIWPTGESRPNFWTIRSIDGLVVANSAIVKTGIGNAINVFASNPADLIIDVTGYFTDDASGSVFYPLTPCRVIETRPAYRNQPGPFGPPALQGGVVRSFRFPGNPSCNVPSGAAAYSLTLTVVPPAPVAFVTAGPTGSSRPNVSTINSPTGRVLANSVIVPANANGSIDIYAFENTDLVVDINGFFAPDNGTGLFYFPVSQCRVAQTNSGSFSGAFGGPILGSRSTRSIPITASGCQGIPVTARGYALNITAMPDAGRSLPFLTVWPTGQQLPNASVLNAFEGQTVSAGFLVPAGVNGSVDVYSFLPSHIALEISGYFGR
jgi:hypothetical protein